MQRIRLLLNYKKIGRQYKAKGNIILNVPFLKRRENCETGTGKNIYS